MKDCDKLSPKAIEIFKKLKLFFPPGPSQELRWKESGKIFDNEWLDLRKGTERQELETRLLLNIGHLVQVEATIYRVWKTPESISRPHRLIQ
ncbi:MAG: hypothetical protein AAB641_00610 [Patescibacteria group bacterium]